MEEEYVTKKYLKNRIGENERKITINHAVMARDFVLVGWVKPIPVNAKVFYFA
jgi:hypothetical protein